MLLEVRVEAHCVKRVSVPEITGRGEGSRGGAEG